MGTAWMDGGRLYFVTINPTGSRSLTSYGDAPWSELCFPPVQLTPPPHPTIFLPPVSLYTFLDSYPTLSPLTSYYHRKYIWRIYHLTNPLPNTNMSKTMYLRSDTHSHRDWVTCIDKI